MVATLGVVVTAASGLEAATTVGLVAVVKVAERVALIPVAGAVSTVKTLVAWEVGALAAAEADNSGNNSNNSCSASVVATVLQCKKRRQPMKSKYFISSNVLRYKPVMKLFLCDDIPILENTMFLNLIRAKL